MKLSVGSMHYKLSVEFHFGPCGSSVIPSRKLSFLRKGSIWFGFASFPSGTSSVSEQNF